MSIGSVIGSVCLATAAACLPLGWFLFGMLPAAALGVFLTIVGLLLVLPGYGRHSYKLNVEFTHMPMEHTLA